VTALDAPLAAATQVPGGLAAVVDYPSVMRGERSETWVMAGGDLPPGADPRDARQCWIPGNPSRPMADLLEEVAIHPAQLHITRAAPGLVHLLQDLASAREAYGANALALLKQVPAGTGGIPAHVARAVSDQRNLFRLAVRRSFPISGLGARAVDLSRGGYANYIAGIVSKREAKIAAGRTAEVVIDATRTNATIDAAGRAARASLPIVRALGVGSVMVAALDIPAQLYRLHVARTDEETAAALRALSDVTTTTALAAACLAFAPGTGGVSLLACGVAPIAAGIFAGEAAVRARALMVDIAR
jgi:hypothetical protein